MANYIINTGMFESLAQRSWNVRSLSISLIMSRKVHRTESSNGNI